MSCGIYKITCKDHVYIGKSINLERRLKQHTYESKHPATYLHRAMATNPWKWEIVTLAPKSKLNSLEKYYIKEHDSFKNGWNFTIGGDNDYQSSTRRVGKKYYWG